MIVALIVFLTIQIIIINLLIYSWLKHKIAVEKRDLLYRNSEKLLLILEGIKTQAYDKIFKEYVLIKAADRIKTNHQELQDAARNYVKVIVEYCGPNLLNDMIEIYGSKDSFYKLLMDGFVTKIILDESQMIEDKINIEEI